MSALFLAEFRVDNDSPNPAQSLTRRGKLWLERVVPIAVDMARRPGVDGTDARFAVAEDLQKGVSGSGTGLVAVAEGHWGEDGMGVLLVVVPEGNTGGDGTGALIAAVAKGKLERASTGRFFPRGTTDVPIVAGRAMERGTI